MAGAMLNGLLSGLWRRTPRSLRRFGVWATQSRFTVTVSAVVTDDGGRVLLLKHLYRGGSGWGIPGGFLEPGEQPEAAVRRELREETGLELEDVRLVVTRTFRRPRQVEIMFRARAADAARAHVASGEVSRAEWYAPDAPPAGLGADQVRLIALALESDAPGRD